MATGSTDLAQTVTAMRPMVPAKDFEVSKRFYVELGFHPRPLTDHLVEGDCCVFCSYGSVPCPPIQTARSGAPGPASCCAL